LPNILPNGLPIRFKKYGIAPDFGAIYKGSNLYVNNSSVKIKKKKKRNKFKNL